MEFALFRYIYDHSSYHYVSRFFVKRCLSDGNILHESRTPMTAMSSKHESISRKGLPSRQVTHIVSESSPDMPAAGDVSLSRYVKSLSYIILCLLLNKISTAL